MQLYDKDLLSMQEVRELVGAAKKAQQELAQMSQAQVDRIVRSIADAGVRNARRLAQMAHEDTGFGIVEDKVVKNVFASRGVQFLVTIWRPHRATRLGCRPMAPLDYYVRLAEGVHAIRKAHGLHNTNDDYKHCGNHPDSDLERLD